ncbi:VWA domain-containing protein [Shewanella sp. SM74]|uniref:VWA domain-containing protein n=1 Tax=Shewanella TaxID=22 RepID=UPI0021D7FC01|nr:VWA domain-containing protein [Shewanella sp. SM74]MCU8014966.1 VWA domain-containing protein [Shewanella sp. SM74]
MGVHLSHWGIGVLLSSLLEDTPMATQTKAKLLRKYNNISRVLTTNNDLTIQFSGNQAYYVPGLINLPAGDFSDDDFITMSLGFCDHELGHENYTDLNWYELASQRSQYLQSLLNALDDVHQEKRLMADFRGTKTTLRKLVELCKVKGLFPPIPEDAPVPSLLHAWVLMKGRCYLEQPVTDLFNQADSAVLAKFGEQFYRDLHSLLDGSILDGLTSTEQCFKAAESIYELLIEWVKDQNVEPEDDSSDSDDANGSDDSEGDSSDSDDVNGSDDSEGGSSDSDDAHGSDSSEGDSSDSDDAKGSDDSEDDTSDSDDANGSDDSEDDSSDSDDAHGSDSSEGDSSDSDDANGNGKVTQQTPNGTQEFVLTEKVLDMLQEIEDFDDDFHEKLAAAIEDMVKDNLDDGGFFALPISKRNHQVSLLNRRYISENCRGLIAKLKNPLKRIFHDQNYVNNSYKNRGKSISSSRLASVGVGNSKVFDSETIHRSPNAAIALMVDKSGSMREADMIMANSVAYSLSTALDGIHGVESMVGYYPVSDDSSGQYKVAVVKPFGEKKSQAAFNMNSDGGTPTAEAITTAVSYLVMRSEPRKLLFVITDGDPNSESQTEQAIADALALGVKVFGIGINARVTGFSESDFQVIHSTDELVNALTKGLKHAFN